MRGDVSPMIDFASLSDELVCTVEGVYISASRTVMFRLPVHGCSDMRGAIRAATRLCPTVRRVVTMSGAEPDMAYIKLADGDWDAIDMRVRAV